MKSVFVKFPIGDVRPEALRLQAFDRGEGFDERGAEHPAQHLVLFEGGNGLVQILRHDGRAVRVSARVSIAFEGRAGIKFAINAVKPGGQRGGKHKIRICHAVGGAIFDSRPALPFRRDADVARSVVVAPHYVIRRECAQHVTLV